MQKFLLIWNYRIAKTSISVWTPWWNLLRSPSGFIDYVVNQAHILVNYLSCCLCILTLARNSKGFVTLLENLRRCHRDLLLFRMRCLLRVSTRFNHITCKCRRVLVVWVHHVVFFPFIFHWRRVSAWRTPFCNRGWKNQSYTSTDAVPSSYHWYIII